MIHAISQFFRPRPQLPAAPAVPEQQLPLKAYKAPDMRPKQIGPRSKVDDLLECVGPGSYRIRVPKDWQPDPLRSPQDVAHDLTMNRLLNDALLGELNWPDGITTVPAKSAAERRAERIATIRRVASGPREYAQLLENEGFNPHEHAWVEPSDEERNAFTERRRGRELLGLLRARIFGK